MTKLIREQRIGKYVVGCRVDKDGVYEVTEGTDYGDYISDYYHYRTGDKKNALATYNRHRRHLERIFN